MKNTFIDDWVAAGGGEDASAGEEPLIMRSMPTALLERTLQRCLMEVKSPALAPVSEGTSSRRLEDPTGSASPCGSSTAGQEPSLLGSSPSQGGPELPALPEGLQVRNTFIHIESVPVVERIVQSMPDPSMFRQCLQAELSAQRTEDAESSAYADDCSSTAPTELVAADGDADPSSWAPPPAGGLAAPLQVAADERPSEPDCIAMGTEVIIQKLVKLPDFNGLPGVVQSLDETSGRYDVLLTSPAGACGWRWVKVKRENLRLRLPPPPRNPPSLRLEVCIPPVAEHEVAVPQVPSTPTWEDYSCHPSAHAHVAPASSAAAAVAVAAGSSPPPPLSPGVVVPWPTTAIAASASGGAATAAEPR